MARPVCKEVHLHAELPASTQAEGGASVNTHAPMRTRSGRELTRPTEEKRRANMTRQTREQEVAPSRRLGKQSHPELDAALSAVPGANPSCTPAKVPEARALAEAQPVASGSRASPQRALGSASHAPADANPPLSLGKAFMSVIRRNLMASPLPASAIPGPATPSTALRSAKRSPPPHPSTSRSQRRVPTLREHAMLLGMDVGSCCFDMRDANPPLSASTSTLLPRGLPRRAKGRSALWRKRVSWRRGWTDGRQEGLRTIAEMSAMPARITPTSRLAMPTPQLTGTRKRGQAEEDREVGARAKRARHEGEDEYVGVLIARPLTLTLKMIRLE